MAEIINLNLILTLFIFLFISTSSANYIAYLHVKRYKYYKQVHRVNLEQSFIGVFAGLPLIFIPFAITETDKGFLKYGIVNNSIFWARLLNICLFLNVIYFPIKFLFFR